MKWLWLPEILQARDYFTIQIEYLPSSWLRVLSQALPAMASGDENDYLSPVTPAECAKSNVTIGSQIVPIASKLEFNVLPRIHDVLAIPLDGGKLDHGSPRSRHRSRPAARPSQMICIGIVAHFETSLVKLIAAFILPNQYTSNSSRSPIAGSLLCHEFCRETSCRS
jgi:hypothetical protein